jgi:hypothetical protein
MESSAKIIQPDNIDYIFIKQPAKYKRVFNKYYKDFEKAIQAGSLYKIARLIKDMVNDYHDSTTLLERINQPEYQGLLMQVCGTCYYRKMSTARAANLIGSPKSHVRAMVMLLLHLMEPELFEPSENKEWKLLTFEQLQHLEVNAKLRYPVIQGK